MCFDIALAVEQLRAPVHGDDLPLCNDMKTIKIQKYIGEQHEKTISVPVILVEALALILPQSGVGELQKHGIDLPALELAIKSSAAYSKTTELTEGGVLKKIVISLE